MCVSVSAVSTAGVESRKVSGGCAKAQSSVPTSVKTSATGLINQVGVTWSYNAGAVKFFLVYWAGDPSSPYEVGPSARSLVLHVPIGKQACLSVSSVDASGTQSQRVSHIIGNILNLRNLIVVRQDNGVSFFL